MPSRRHVKSQTVKYGLARLRRFQEPKLYTYEISTDRLSVLRVGVTLVNKEK